MRQFIVICFLTLSLPCFAQVNLDSLWAVWNDKSQTDTNRLKAIHTINWNSYVFNKPDSAFYFAQLEYDLAKKSNNKKQMAAALNTQGASFYLRSDYVNALDYYKRSLNLNEELGHKKGISSALGNIGTIYTAQGDYAKAIEHYTTSLNIKEEISDKKGIANTLTNIGIIYSEQGEKDKALDYHIRSLKIYREIDNKKGISNSLNNIGNIYDSQGEYNKALVYHQKSLKIREEMNDKEGIALSFVNIGFVFKYQGDYDKSLKYYSMSSRIFEEIGNKKGLSRVLINTSIVYQDQKDYTRAISYGIRAFDLANEIGEAQGIKQSSESLYKSYKEVGNLQKSLEMYELYITYRDSIKSEENQKEIVRQEFKYEYEKRSLEDRLEFEKKEAIKDLKLKKSENTKWFFIVVSFLTLLLTGFIYYGFKQKQRVNIYLKERNKFEIENKKKAVALFGQQVSKEVASELLSDTFKTGSKKILACIMFLDIREFTPFAENKEPSEIIQYQNDVFGFMIDVISKHNGIIIQFMGDGFMATFGAPVSSGNDNQNAVNASLEIVKLLNKKCELGEIPLTKIGIGLHAGNIVTGNVGTAERKQYSITGNTVILASRIEQLNKKYNSEILISNEVLEALDQKDFKMEKLGPVKVKGRAEPIEIVRLI